MREGFALILSAPSGTGKTTTCKLLKEKLPNLRFAISHTTRKIRTGETDGVDYHFISQDEFETKIKNNDFLEWAKVHDCYYGTSLQAVNTLKSEGYDTLIELDVQGVESLRKMDYQGVFILILPPSIIELEARLRKRGTDSEKSILQRLDTATKEIKQFNMYDYVITNHKVEDTADSILSILHAESVKSSKYIPASPDIESILNGDD